MNEAETVINQPAVSKGTEYVLLELNPESPNPVWAQVARVRALNAPLAIRQHVGETATSGTFVAIPERSFKRRTVSVVSKQTVQIS